MKGLNMNQKIQTQDLQPSSEMKKDEIQLAKQQGEAFQEAIKYMTNQQAHGEEKVAGDYLIGWASEKAEGLYVMRAGQLQWQGPQAENTHLEIAVCNATDGRFVPGLTVYATLFDQDGNEIDTHQQPFLWHPWLYHYGRNWRVPNEGPYTLRVRVEAADFPRHDKLNGKHFDQPVEVEFPNIKLQIGQKSKS
jgi:hypothetical protein